MVWGVAVSSDQGDTVLFGLLRITGAEVCHSASVAQSRAQESWLALVNSNLILTPDSLDNGHGGHSTEPTLGCSQQGPVSGDKYLPVMTWGG